MKKYVYYVIAVLFLVAFVTSCGGGGGSSGSSSDCGSLPAQVTSPNPANTVTNIPISQQLSWASTIDPTSYDVYFGTSSPPSLVSSNQAGTSYDPGPLSYNTTYYWRINSKNSAGTTSGLVWSFRTVVSIGSNTYNYTGGQQTWTVPNGIYSITVDCRGAKGSGGNSNNGARAQTTLSVTPGQTLYIYVGGVGGVPTGGWNGGGNGGNGPSGDGGGGGGGSDIRSGGTALGNRVVVASGGGGAGMWDGGAGGQNGSAGVGNYPGGGGTQSAGGAGGSGPGPGTVGVLGTGGTGGNYIYGGGGGGGGGGYYGGGGGDGNAIDSRSGGGGGSSYAGTGTSGPTYTTGYQSGNGQIIITY